MSAQFSIPDERLSQSTTCFIELGQIQLKDLRKWYMKTPSGQFETFGTFQRN
jgi:hypothetical protein